MEKNVDVGERVSMDVEEEVVVDDKKRKYNEDGNMKKDGTNKHGIKNDTTSTPLQHTLLGPETQHSKGKDGGNGNDTHFFYRRVLISGLLGKMTIISWSFPGLGNSSAVPTIRDLFRKYMLNILFLCECMPIRLL